MRRCCVLARTSEAPLRPTGSRRKNRIFREVLYAPRFRPISEIDRRPGRGGYNYAVAGGARFRSSGHRPPLYSTAELILRPGWIDTLPRGPPGDSDASRDSAVALSVGKKKASLSGLSSKALIFQQDLRDVVRFCEGKRGIIRVHSECVGFRGKSLSAESCRVAAESCRVGI